ncbi:MAG TPA: PHP domain-containing protein [Puia sp.]|jgi:DNA polymerase (family 10)
MNIDNDYIADRFSLLAKLMDIHGENSFKTKSYSVAAFTLEKLPHPIADLPPEKFTSIKGIGDAIGKKIQQILHTGELPLLQEYIAKTPPGIIEMLRIKGLGPKKIATIWKEMEVESIGELLYACQENRLLLYKGFGAKTQQSVLETIEFFLKSQGSHLYAEIEPLAHSVESLLQENFKNEKLTITGDFRRQLEIIDQLQWVTTITPDSLRTFFEEKGYTTAIPTENSPAPSHFKGPEGVDLSFLHTTPETFAATLLTTSCSGEFLEAWPSPIASHDSEEAIFSAAGIHFIPPFRREQRDILEAAAAGPLPDPIQTSDIRAIIHSHSDWSDGSNTLEEMAKACIKKGYEYLVISDHSKSAFYANGLKEDRILEQHKLIDELNRQLAPFTIFKSIECDILNDGALDYSPDILSTFDLVITSVHSNLKMSEEKAMLRLLGAIHNPYTTILGHMTGRLLLSRPGYPVDHKKIIEACAENNVAIELNAHPRRLDMDWRWIGYALGKGVRISIDPDAHSTEGYEHVKYGVLAAQKAGVTAAQNLSSFTLAQFREFLAERKKVKGI